MKNTPKKLATQQSFSFNFTFYLTFYFLPQSPPARSLTKDIYKPIIKIHNNHIKIITAFSYFHFQQDTNSPVTAIINNTAAHKRRFVPFAVIIFLLLLILVNSNNYYVFLPQALSVDFRHERIPRSEFKVGIFSCLLVFWVLYREKGFKDLK